MEYDVRVYTNHHIVADDGEVHRFGALCPPSANPESSLPWNELRIVFDPIAPVPLMEHGKHYRITITELPDE